jgi:hypothetical protein
VRQPGGRECTHRQSGMKSVPEYSPVERQLADLPALGQARGLAVSLGGDRFRGTPSRISKPKSGRMTSANGLNPSRFDYESAHYDGEEGRRYD